MPCRYSDSKHLDHLPRPHGLPSPKSLIIRLWVHCWPRSLVGLQRPDVGLARSGGPVAAGRTSQIWFLPCHARSLHGTFCTMNPGSLKILVTYQVLSDILRSPKKIQESGALRQGHSLRRGRRWFWQAILDEGPRATGTMKGAWSVTSFSGVCWLLSSPDLRIKTCSMWALFVVNLSISGLEISLFHIVTVVHVCYCLFCSFFCSHLCLAWRR